MAKRARKEAPVLPPIGNFPPTILETEDDSKSDAEQSLDGSALEFLDDPQGFIDAVGAEAQAKGHDAHNINVALDVLKTVLGVASTFVPGVAIGVPIINAIEGGVSQIQ